MSESASKVAAHNAIQHVRHIAQRFGELPQVLAVALAGSRAAETSDSHSDFDLYVYSLRDVPIDFRRSLAPANAEINNTHFETGDEWLDPSSGARLDIMYRSPAWIEDQLDRVLLRHQASVGYSTCFWYNVLHSQPLFDPQGWYAALQTRSRQPYPDALRRAILAKNWPLLRRNQSSFRHQIDLALQRNDAFSVHHRLTALLACYFDVWFALERQPHPGEKRLLTHLPAEHAALVRALLRAQPDILLAQVDNLVDSLDRRLCQEGLLDTHGQLVPTP